MWPLSFSEVVYACGAEPQPDQPFQDIISMATTDSRKTAPGSLFVAIQGEKFDGHQFVSQALSMGAIAALVQEDWFHQQKTMSKSEKIRLIPVKSVIESYRRLACSIRARFCFPVIAIGGSNGKTTTKEMLASMLSGGSYRITRTEKSENGFLGLPITLTDERHTLLNPPHALVLEIGIDEPGSMDQHLAVASPNFVTLTAMGPEHLTKLKTWECGIEEEWKLFENSRDAIRIWQCSDEILRQKLTCVKESDVIVYPKSMASMFAGLQCHHLSFAISASESIRTKLDFEWTPRKIHCSPKSEFHLEVPMPGNHNAQNAALAAGCALGMGRTVREIKLGWSQFQGPAMRSQVTRLPNGSWLYNDCYNASPSSMTAALQALQSAQWERQPKVLVLGDMLDLGDESKKWHFDLLSQLLNTPFDLLCLYGDAMYDVYQEIKQKSDVLRNKSAAILHMRRAEDPREFVRRSEFKASGTVILVKGSRGMDLGRVVQHIEQSVT